MSTILLRNHLKSLVCVKQKNLQVEQIINSLYLIIILKFSYPRFPVSLNA